MLNKETKNKNVERQGGFTMNLRKLMAGTLTATMIVGSSMTVLAADANGATGSGESIGHVDKKITTVTLPTDTGVNGVFNYYVDPERVIDLAGELKDGTTVTKNEDGVYFKNKGDSGDTYSSSSDAVEFVGKNSVDVDVSVKAEVKANAGDKDIALVADDEALAAATTPALLMNLKVGSATKAITSEGATAKAKLEGKEENFEVTVESGAYKFAATAAALADKSLWDNTTVQLSGKTNKMDVTSDMTAPTIELTWTIAEHQDFTDETGYGNWSGSELWIGKDADTGFSTSNLTVEVSSDGTTYTALASGKYSVSSDNWVSITWDNATEVLDGDLKFVRVTDGSIRYTFENE